MSLDKTPSVLHAAGGIYAQLGEFKKAKPWAGAPCKCGSRQKKYTGPIRLEFRRSAAVALRRAGVAEGVIMAIGGWKTRSMFDRYAIVSPTDRAAAMQLLQQAREREPNSTFSQNQPVAAATPVTEKVQ